MFTLTMPRRAVMLWILIAVIILLIYIPLNIIYILATPKEPDIPNVGTGSLFSDTSIKIKNTGELLHLKDMHMRNDGTVDFTVNVKIVDMLKYLNAFSDKSFHGEMTLNPLPIHTSFFIRNEHVCSGVDHLDALVYIHSASPNHAKRQIIRSTWAHKDLFKDWSTRRIFLMGAPHDTNERKKMEEENKLHGDLVVGDFADEYRNLTLKAIMGLKWTSQYCPHAKYVIKADDDAFLNIFEMRQILKQHSDKENLIVCPLWKENTMPILRDPALCMKWCVKFYEFPGRTHFPQYCAGLSYIMSQPVVPSLYKASLSTPFFWIDDVYISGMLPAKVKGIHFVDLLRNFTLKEAVADEQYSKPLTQKVSYYIAHVKDKNRFYKMWNLTLHRLPPNELSNLGKHVFTEYPTLTKLLR